MKQVSSANITYITPKGLEKLENELAHLRSVERKEIAKYLQETMGDVEDNDCLIALERQAFVEGRIRQLEMLLRNVQVIQPGENNCGIVDLGSTVVLRDANMDFRNFYNCRDR